MERYLLCLFRQYCDARRINISNINNIYSKDFIDWIVENNNLLDKYIIYLHDLGFDYLSSDVLEINKGKYDSLYKYDVSLISIFGSTMGNTNSIFLINNGSPLVIKDNGIIALKDRILLTHNPYYEDEVINWRFIHNGKNNDISIGMFGKINDENRKRKVNILIQLSRLINDDYSLDYDTIDDNYFCTLNSKRKIKSLIKTR